jgi:hypothetical protein
MFPALTRVDAAVAEGFASGERPRALILETERRPAISLVSTVKGEQERFSSSSRASSLLRDADREPTVLVSMVEIRWRRADAPCGV